MSFLRTIDDSFFDNIFERFCHWSQQNIGKTHKFWEKLSLGLFLIVIVISTSYRMLHGMIYGWNLILFAAMATDFLFFNFSIENKINDIMNFKRQMLIFLVFRILFLCMLIGNIFDFCSVKNYIHTFNLIEGILLFCIYYFSACTDLPESKTRNKIAEMFMEKVRVRIN